MKNVKTKNKEIKEIPVFKNEDEEREFWANHSSTDFVDWSKAEEVTFPNLKPTTQSISIRLSVSLLNDLKSIAKGMDVPYQSLIKMLLNESIRKNYPKAG